MINPKVHSEISKNPMTRSKIRHYFYGFHRRYWKVNCISTQSYDLLATRILSLLIWLYVIILQCLAYNNLIKPSMIFFNFLFGSSHSLLEISAILYTTGTAVYGISFEIYMILPLVIINCLILHNNCGIHHQETKTMIIYCFKALALFIGTELCYQNFKRFTFHQSYELHSQKASRAILRQSIYLTVTIMFLISPGLRSIYNTVQFKCPYLNKSLNETQCNLIDIQRPVSEENAICVADYTALVTSMEQLRISRDIALCSIAFYSMYNKSFLDITGTRITIINKIMLVLFFAISCSVLVVNTDPLHFDQMKIYFDIIEIIFFIILVILLIINLHKKFERKSFVIMTANPTIFG